MAKSKCSVSVMDRSDRQYSTIPSAGKHRTSRSARNERHKSVRAAGNSLNNSSSEALNENTTQGRVFDDDRFNVSDQSVSYDHALDAETSDHTKYKSRSTSPSSNSDGTLADSTYSSSFTLAGSSCSSVAETRSKFKEEFGTDTKYDFQRDAQTITRPNNASTVKPKSEADTITRLLGLDIEEKVRTARKPKGNSRKRSSRTCITDFDFSYRNIQTAAPSAHRRVPTGLGTGHQRGAAVGAPSLLSAPVGCMLM